MLIFNCTFVKIKRLNNMKALVLIIWMLLTFILAISIVGWALIVPVPNNSFEFSPISDRRSTWMSIGVGLYNNLIGK